MGILEEAKINAETMRINTARKKQIERENEEANKRAIEKYKLQVNALLEECVCDQFQKMGYCLFTGKNKIIELDITYPDGRMHFYTYNKIGSRYSQTGNIETFRDILLKKLTEFF